MRKLKDKNSKCKLKLFSLENTEYLQCEIKFKALFKSTFS